MAVIPVPAKFGFTKVDQWGIIRAGRTARSRFTGSRQTIVLPYAVWSFEGTLVNYPEPEANDIRAFLIQLEGQANEFDLPVPGYVPKSLNQQNCTFQTYGDGGAPIRGRTISMRIAWTTTVDLSVGATFAKRGDYFRIGNELKIVTQDCLSVGSDTQVINFEPPLRQAYPHNTLMDLKTPTCRMSAVDDEIGTWGLQAPVIHNFELKAMESF
jgi:hypothetical protein